jgi:site-specific DNA recombinase
VINRLRAFFTDQGAILDAVRDEHPDGANQKRLISRGRQIAVEIVTMAPDQIRALLMALISRVDIKPDRVEINITSPSLSTARQSQYLPPRIEITISFQHALHNARLVEAVRRRVTS